MSSFSRNELYDKYDIKLNPLHVGNGTETLPFYAILYYQIALGAASNVSLSW